MNNIITNPQHTSFNGKTIRYFTAGGRSVLCLIDIAHAIGDTLRNIITHTPDEYLSIVSIETPTGDQHMITITAEAVYAILLIHDNRHAPRLLRHLLRRLNPSVLQANIN